MRVAGRGYRDVLFYIQQMNRVNSRNNSCGDDGSTINIVLFIIIIIIIFFIFYFLFFFTLGRYIPEGV